MTPDQQEKLLDLHRAAVTAAEALGDGTTTPEAFFVADDAFRTYLMNLTVETRP